MKSINIWWEGPFTLPQIQQQTAPHDKGLYQIYGAHPISGKPELLYIGLTTTTFAHRVPKHFSEWLRWTRDPSLTAVYLGRLQGPTTPDEHTWNNEIEIAEALLIYAHMPPQNVQKNGAESRPGCMEYRVLNRGSYRELWPEVSGEHQGTMPPIQTYGTHGRLAGTAESPVSPPSPLVSI